MILEESLAGSPLVQIVWQRLQATTAEVAHQLFDTLSEIAGTRLVFSTLSGNGALADEYACVLRIVFGKERGWNVAQKSEYNAYSKDDPKTRN